MITISQVRLLGHTITNYHWDLQFLTMPAIPGAPPPYMLNLRCKSATLPKKTIETGEISIRGHKIPIVGATTRSDSIELTFVEQVDMMIHDFILKWRELVSESETGFNAPPEMYQATIQLLRLSRQGIPVWRYILIGAFIKDYSYGSDLDGEPNGDAVMPSITLGYVDFKEGRV